MSAPDEPRTLAARAMPAASDPPLSGVDGRRRDGTEEARPPDGASDADGNPPASPDTTVGGPAVGAASAGLQATGVADSPHRSEATPGGSDDVAGDDGGSGGDESTDAPAEQPGGKRTGRRVARTIVEWVAVVGGALLVALVVKTFLVQAFWIPSPSMRPTLQEGDRVLVNKLADGIDDINLQDVIVFKRPDNGDEGGHPESEINDLIKRVVGLPGDTIEARNGVLYVNGHRLDEPYVAADTPTADMGPIEVPEDHVYVMGDNRTNSQDSRYFGAVPGENIVGRAFVRIWPLSNLGRL